MHGDERFITPEQFRQQLKKKDVEICIDTVYRWCRSRRLSARKIASKWRIDEREVRRVAETGI